MLPVAISAASCTVCYPLPVALAFLFVLMIPILCLHALFLLLLMPQWNSRLGIVSLPFVRNHSRPIY